MRRGNSPEKMKHDVGVEQMCRGTKQVPVRSGAGGSDQQRRLASRWAAAEGAASAASREERERGRGDRRE